MKNLCARCVKRNAYDLFLKAYGGDKPRTADRAAQTSAERQAQHPRPRSRSTSSLHANGGPVLGRRPNVRISGQVRSGLHANGGPVLGRRRNVRISQLLFSYGKLYNGQRSTLYAPLGSLFQAQGEKYCETTSCMHQRLQNSTKSGRYKLKH